MVVKILAAAGITIGLLTIFIVIFLLNKKAKVPDDCPKDALPEGCSGCMLSCGKREEDFSLKAKLTGKQSDLKEEMKDTDENKEEK